jgi:hypothetical protein
MINLNLSSFLTILVFAAPLLFAASGDPPSHANPAGVFGVAHVDGKYFLTTEDFLDEGADQILATGSKVIKLYLTPRRYPWNSHWPENLRSLAEVAQSAYFKSVFAKPFHTYILTAYSIGRQDHYWTDGVTLEQAADETQQFYELSKYLLAAYKGAGKTFVLQHWEGDWALRRGSPKPYDPDYIPSPTAIKGMIAWLNARQAGIVKARSEAGATDVHIYGAAEANRLEDSMADKPGVANSVLPFTTVDLASYSSYKFLDTPERLAKAVDYMAAHLPPTAAFGQNPRSIYLGEFGYPENGSEGVAGVNTRFDNAIKITTEKGLPWAVFWEVYCNEPVDNSPPLPLNGKTNDHNVRGFWMVKPDGSPSIAWHRYRHLFTAADPVRRLRRERATEALQWPLKTFADHAVYYSFHQEELQRTALSRARLPSEVSVYPEETLSLLCERLDESSPVLLRNLTPPMLVGDGLDWRVVKVIVLGLQPLHGDDRFAHLGGRLWLPRGIEEWSQAPPHPFP